MSVDLDTTVVYSNQRVPVIEYVNRIVLSTDEQSQLVEHFRTIYNKYYVQSLVKGIISNHERKGLEVSEDLYELYCEPEILGAIPLKSTDLDIITYRINDYDVKIRETPNVIAGQGTTGLRTWEAGFFLATYVKDLELSGSVCEIGTGTGLVGILLHKTGKANKILFTDGDTGLFENLQHNLELNNIKSLDHEIFQLVWGSDDYHPKVDYVIAADVTYDSSVFEELVLTLSVFLKNGCKKCYVAATIRNEDTRVLFEDTVKKHQLSLEILTTFVPSHNTIWIRPGNPCINLYCLYL